MLAAMSARLAQRGQLAPAADRLHHLRGAHAGALQRAQLVVPLRHRRRGTKEASQVNLDAVKPDSWQLMKFPMSKAPAMLQSRNTRPMRTSQRDVDYQAPWRRATA